ncbi:MAG: 1-acyl-sn-glycerol-3-phosphate acyltransferase [Desulfobacterales bacterium]|nr:1-acyl-sn-glycerol-3-phosphate acyltransferase [Desulfobacterales bacterium]MDX2511006.1 1-acyl-sn-glycerol-3-phosphate acyltransferase [Desulfobacterales bacterium]
MKKGQDKNKSQSKSTWRRMADALLKGTHQHYLCYLPAHKGLFSSWLLKRFFSGIKSNQQQIQILKDIPENATVVYLNKFQSYFEFLFYHTRFSENKRPVPELGFNYHTLIFQPLSRLLRVLFARFDFLILKWKLPNPYRDGYFHSELSRGKSAFLSLVDKKGFYKRFVKAQSDPIYHLIELQKKLDRDIYIVPLLMSFGKKPFRSIPTILDILLGPEAKPGVARRLTTLFRNPKKIFYEVSKPVSLRHFLETPDVIDMSMDHQALVLRRNLLLQINRHKQSITGPMKKSMEELKESILTSDRLKDYLDEHAIKRDLPISKIRRKADSYIDEIACKQNPGLIRSAEIVIGWVLNTMFQGISYNEEELQHIKAISQKRPIVFVPCHKSHVDYLMLPYLMYRNNMAVPYIAAGANLSFWPIGPIFRALGAFFLRRTFRGNVLYSKVFSEYIHQVLLEGYNIKIFIEGTRSRTGKLIMPKLGFLSILMNAYKNGACDDLVFAPIYIGYDHVLEEKSYLHEIEGGKKEPESFLQVVSARKFLKNRYGKIYIKFHPTISLNKLLEQEGTRFDEMLTKDQNALCRNMGHRIINAINTVTVITPHALVASVLLNTSKERLSYHDLLRHVEVYLQHVTLQNADITDTLVMDHTHAVENVLEDYAGRKLIERIDENKDGPLSEAIYKVNVSKRPVLEYYKNNCISFFVPAAFTALAILEKDAFQFSASDLQKVYLFLQDFFKYEFAFDVDKATDFYLRKTIKSFIDDAIIIPHPTLPETYNITSAGFRKLKHYSQFLKTYFESYWIVLNYFRRNPQNGISTRDKVKKIQTYGTRLYKNKEIDLIESLSKINYSNGINFFTTHRVKGSEDGERIEFYTNIIQNYLNRINH